MLDETPIKTTVEELRKLINIENYIGEPIETEDKIIIPVSKAGCGFGIGENQSKSTLTGTAAGAGVEPISMVVVTKGVRGAEGIRTLNLSKGNEYNKALSDLGLIVTDILKGIVGPMMGMEDPVYQEADSTIINTDNIQNGEYEEAANDFQENAENINEEIKETAENTKETKDNIKKEINID